MTMRQLRQQLNAREKKDAQQKAEAKPAAYVLACRYCGGELLADGDGGWTCPRRDKHTPTLPAARHWAVSVHRNGENILTIESNMLAGKPEFSAEDEECIRDCARHLLAFIGQGLIPGRLPFYCASCSAEFPSRGGMYQDANGLWQHNEEGGMSCCGPVLLREKAEGK